MSTERSTIALLHCIAQAEASREVPVIAGNASDVFAARDGSIMDLLHLLAQEAAAEPRATVVFSIAKGSYDLRLGGRLQPSGLRHVTTEAGAAIALGDLMGQLPILPLPTRLVIDYSDLLLPTTVAGSDPTAMERERIIELLIEQARQLGSRRTDHRMLILPRAGGGIDDRLAGLPGFRTIDVPLPNRPERLAVLNRLMHPQVGQPLRLESGLAAEQAATLAGGLVNLDLLAARAMCSSTGEPLTRAWIQRRKSDTIQRTAGDALVVYPPGRGLADVAGLPQVRLIIREAVLTGRPPRRILLAGPPGVGKTLVVRAIADELGYPCVALGNYRNMYVGETERRFRRALQVVRDLAPCVLHLDEIDQSVGQRTTGQSGDGGTSERVLADMWNFLGTDLADPVTVIATTNRPELLDAAMFDRFEIVPVLHPTPPEAAQVLRIAARELGHDLDVVAAEQEVLRHGGLVTGRVLVDVMHRAATLAATVGQNPTSSHLRAAFEDLLAPVDQREHEQLALRAISLAKFRSRLPWEAARILGEPTHVPYYVSAIATEGGRLDSRVPHPAA